MKDDMKLNYILFFVLSFGIIILSSYLFPTKSPKKAQPKKPPSISEVQRETVSGAYQVEKQEEEETKEAPFSSPVPEGRLITIKTPLYTSVIDTAGGRIVQWELSKYKETSQTNSPEVNLLKGLPLVFNTALKLQGIRVPNPIPFDLGDKGTGDVIKKVLDREKQITLYWKSPEGITVRKIIRFTPSSYVLEHRFEVVNSTEKPIGERVSVEWYGNVLPSKGRGNERNFIAMVYDDIKRIDKVSEGNSVLKGVINWFGFSDKYFISVFLPEVGDETEVYIRGVEEVKGLIKGVFTYPEGVIPPGAKIAYESKLYLGPKDYEIMHSFGHGLERSVDYGWVGVLARPLLKILKIINVWVKNYGIAIIVITLLVRIVFLPLTIKSMASMKEMGRKMKEIQPKIKELKEKYKDDKQRQNQELMKLYSSKGVNPLSSLGGCLPLIIQIPVFFALYEVLLYSIELRHSPFLWINDLSEPEHLFDMPGVGIPFRILPLLMGGSWYLSQKLTPTAPTAEPMQAKIMEFMPIIFTVLFWGLPSGLILYWTVSNILSIFQQFYVNRDFERRKGGAKDASSD